jgi:hypothetical protein
MLKRLTLVVLSLVVGAGVGSAQFLPSGPPELDHFYCYFVQSPLQQMAVQLQDQFDVRLQQIETITDLRAVRLCNPVQKTLPNGVTTPIQHPQDHLLFYLINPQPVIPRLVLVDNQFGLQLLRTRNAEVLAVPSGKALPVVSASGTVGPPAAPPIPQDLNHFKCYSASGDVSSRVVSLQDQFQSVQTEVLEPILFCNPVQKTIPAPPSAVGGLPGTVTPIVDPRAHLTCYTTVPRPFQGVAYYNNQFVPAGPVGSVPPTTVPPELTVLSSDILCLPSYKLGWIEINYPSATVPIIAPIF